MTLDWWVDGTLLGLLTVSALPPGRARLMRQPRLLGGVPEELDDHTEMYVLTSVRGGRSTTIQVIATWEQVVAYAAERSMDVGTLYVCVLLGIRKWYWRCGLMTDDVFRAPARSHATRSRHRRQVRHGLELAEALNALARRTSALSRLRRRLDFLGEPGRG